MWRASGCADMVRARQRTARAARLAMRRVPLRVRNDRLSPRRSGLGVVPKGPLRPSDAAEGGKAEAVRDSSFLLAFPSCPDLPPCISPTIGPQRRRIGSLAAPLEREQRCKDAGQGDTSGEEEPVHRLEPKQHPTRHFTDSSTVSFATLTYSNAIVKKMCLTVTNTHGERAVPTRLRQPL